MNAHLASIGWGEKKTPVPAAVDFYRSLTPINVHSKKNSPQSATPSHSFRELLKRDVEMADLLTLQQIAELKEAFAIFDKDGDGSVTSSDLAEVFAAVGQRVPHDVLNRMLTEADIDANGVVDFPEFLTLYAQRLHDDDHRETEMRSMFLKYDLGLKGFITASNLQYAMGTLGCRLTLAEADEMLREADMDGDGKLRYEEFRRMLMTADV